MEEELYFLYCLKSMCLTLILHEFYNGMVYLKQIIKVLYTTKYIIKLFANIIIIVFHSAFK
ncbi:hypothetical protein COA08_25460 [Bacillus cereus]|uniref:Uncharacterized protein n=1 Tax=Bacillus cereus TaxID=1396 RepID=A0A2B8TDV2_BACCE|nr:hypothetical protein CON06_25130 [Bacillus cereus]PFA12398.1 hypothetical protein CN382_16775 [Bacillus cereus]PFM35149.1 hypothetical protein COJ43_23120 [Bacillus cereus]PGL63101.1 hypothetical protein CN927_07910 [Bacillus cereus]PGQ05713.1 hypothetical protein COA08_25460 [Bacillus cereus]